MILSKAPGELIIRAPDKEKSGFFFLLHDNVCLGFSLEAPEKVDFFSIRSLLLHRTSHQYSLVDYDYLVFYIPFIVSKS